MMNLNSGKRQSTSWRWRNDLRSERNLCNCVRKPEKKNSGLEFLNFCQASLRNYINCVHCGDHFFIFISFPQIICDLFHISLTKYFLPSAKSQTLPNLILVPYTYNVYQIRSNVFAQSMIFSIRESHKKCWSGTILSFKNAAPSSRRSCTTFLDLHVIFKVIHSSWHKKNYTIHNVCP